jgi:hypothetical protein
MSKARTSHGTYTGGELSIGIGYAYGLSSAYGCAIGVGFTQQWQ